MSTVIMIMIVLNVVYMEHVHVPHCTLLSGIFTNNTIINITSKSVVLHDNTTMGSGKITNIAIIGSNVTIMCNNSGSVYCESCNHVSIEGITWDRCSDPNGTNIAGVTFNGTSNISLVNCTFQHSLITACSCFIGIFR